MRVERLLILPVALAVTMALSGCFGIGERYLPSAPEIVGRDWFKAPPPPRARSPLYCYRTLGRADCHRAPVAGDNGRLAGYYGPPPEGVGY